MQPGAQKLWVLWRAFEIKVRCRWEGENQEADGLRVSTVGGSFLHCMHSESAYNFTEERILLLIESLKSTGFHPISKKFLWAHVHINLWTEIHKHTHTHVHLYSFFWKNQNWLMFHGLCWKESWFHFLFMLPFPAGCPQVLLEVRQACIWWSLHWKLS